jgi:Protein of unknown function (DUF4232)
MTLPKTVLVGTAGLALVVGAAAVAGCSSPSSSSSSSSAATTPAAPASSAPPATSPSATSSAPASGSASSAAVNPGGPAGAPGCATKNLKATVGVAQGAAGSVYQVIDFTNIGSSSCSLYGYPGVALAGGTPVAQVGAAASRSTSTAPSLVTLAAGATGNALLRITVAQNYPQSTCKPTATTYLQIYPPNQTTPIYLAYKSTGCSATSVNLLTIGVVQSGSGSNGT